MKKGTVAIANLGCKTNQYDGTHMAALLQKFNFSLVDFKEMADIYVINTCTVTNRADADSRNIIRRAHRRNPEAIIVVTGCYAQVQPEEVAKIEGVRLVLGNSKKGGLLDFLEKVRQEREKVHIEVEDIFRQTDLEAFGLSNFTQNTRAYVKIQDGCNQYCSFCIVPFARGRNRSIPIPKVIEELQRLSDHGFKEVILTGIHIGTYGEDLNPAINLVSLLKEIERTKPVHRVRLSSIDPEEISEELIDLLSDSNVFCPHLHIPLQSGDDAILKMMRRRYDRKFFLELCEKLVQRVPRIGIGADVIVGFPYEDESRFEKTVDLLERAPINYFHVFPFSPKEGTQAAKMMGQVPHGAKKERAGRLRELSKRKSGDFRKKFLGKNVEVVLERLSDSCQYGASQVKAEWVGFSENYLPILVQVPNGFSGQLVRCHLEKEKGESLAGKNY